VSGSRSYSTIKRMRGEKKSILVGVHPGREGAGRDVILDRPFNRRHGDVGDPAIVKAALQVVFLRLVRNEVVKVDLYTRKRY
jgi:hypothetical protein